MLIGCRTAAIRRLLAPFGLVIWFVVSASAQTEQQPLSTTDALMRTVQTSLCEVLRNPKQFNGIAVLVHARNSGTWEGSYLSDPSCGQSGAIYLAYPNPEPMLPKQYASLSVFRDEGLTKFEADSRVLCNGMSLLCDFDYLEGDFTGLVMVKDGFRVERGFGNGFGHLGMSKIQFVMLHVANPKLHAVDEPLLKSSEVPTEIERSGGVHVLTPAEKAQPEYCATEAVQPNFVLKKARQVSGAVQDVTGAAFGITEFQLRKYHNGTEIAYKSATTAKDGNFDFGTVEAGEYRLLTPNRGWKQPIEIKCSEVDKCLLRIVLKPNPTDMPYASCPVK